MYLQTFGKGDINLVFLHGWAINSKIWNTIIPLFEKEFLLHLIDLPGYGCNPTFNFLTLNDLAKQLIPFLPDQSVVIGWSLGGLIAMQLALIKPKKLRGIITVSSSPKFISTKSWPGIKPKILDNFKYHVQNNLKQAIERFLILQTLGLKNSHINILNLKRMIFSQPIPSIEVLSNGLKILYDTDLRKELALVKIPFLRIYGSLDSLVPRNIVPILDDIIPKSSSIILEKAAHAPFISHPYMFYKYVVDFLNI
ncbi:pimeloyl-[acyl-carrier protein] methyl ester esterase [Candidatus Pantoea edessiphila]|uniref:Pimeloyl-[acyl-carrier protein] methyl ester esterase n=1 Tax=Candidatus Pantoea edessiphila TaxID=2044610 RepID=A0A2P5SXU8_9GAMM|nr:pimeloyl-ACP methyl ester esterase BioH [Candidatus Pantoea edessiphila]MBK4775763.1 pimeloyl-ACP methyl ester esterase BioH [Pantoea sp. Edef]PPI87159.1 pimeloyl-[acyl-carrier protein] methyl ester esterase [Candidatus Pantoea edessiphila]